MKISLFAVVAAVVAVAVASPVPISSQSVESPSLKTANVSAILPEDLIAKRDVTGLVKRGNNGGTHLAKSPFFTIRAWKGGVVAAKMLAQSFQNSFLQDWDSKHKLVGRVWSLTTRILMSNGYNSEVMVNIEDHYEVSAEKVAEMVFNAVLDSSNECTMAQYDVFDKGDGDSRAWGKVVFHEVL
ncbi:hypothetical protein F5H01DRAFT_356318 [Linnemannia elongata]|nr:hypothetical protein F5H01DRAFT_356318 [Linnemannia elongata]